MIFWAYMLIMNLLIPVTMIGFGRHFMKSAPKNINTTFGYRTSMSMKSMETWEFAHKSIGKLWSIMGLVLLPITVFLMVSSIGSSVSFIGWVGGIICLVQLVVMLCSIIPTEISLKKNFDEFGKRK